MILSSCQHKNDQMKKLHRTDKNPPIRLHLRSLSTCQIHRTNTDTNILSIHFLYNYIQTAPESMSEKNSNRPKSAGHSSGNTFKIKERAESFKIRYLVLTLGDELH